MKYLLLILLPVFCQAQYADDYTRPEKVDGVSKGDNLITIRTDRDQQENYVSFTRYLADHWYGFEQKDQDLMMLVTSPMDPGKGAYDYKLNVRFVGNDIIVKVSQSGLSVGAGMLHDAELIWAEWHYAKSPSNYMRKSFDHFYPVLEGYGYPVSFSRQ